MEGLNWSGSVNSIQIYNHPLVYANFYLKGTTSGTQQFMEAWDEPKLGKVNNMIDSVKMFNYSSKKSKCLLIYSESNYCGT